MLGVELRNVVKAYEGHTIIQGANLQIKKGEFVVFVGPSGCGKSTLMRTIAGLEEITSGEILIHGEVINDTPPSKRGVAMVFQSYALYPHMTVYDNMSFSLKLAKVPKAEIDERVKKAATSLQMMNLLDRLPKNLSGGQRQRVAIGRAIIREPKVFLFDEPLSNLDAKLRLHMRDEIRKLQQEVGITSVYVTHDQAEAMALSDKIVIMKDGEIAQVGSPFEIYQKPNSEFVAKFIGRANILDAEILEKSDKSTKIRVLGVEYNVNEVTEYSVGETAKVVVRPESVKFDENIINLEVVKSIFMGENHEYEVKSGDQVLELTLSNPHGKEIKKVGEMLSFGFDEESIHII